MIPQYSPLIDRKTLAKEMSDYILSDGYMTEYKNTEQFEKEIAKFLKVKHCIMVNNGTISLSLALLAMGVKPGDNVLIPNITMFATQAAVQLIGANPIFIDIDPYNLCMDIPTILNYIEENPIKAIIYVTLNGRSHGMGTLEAFYGTLDSYKIGIIEDNAQSFGSFHNDFTPISCPKEGIGSFSFSMPKIITTGQGGCLVTDNDYYASKIKKLKDFGREKGGIDLHDQFGINSKFTEFQAIMGLNQLKNINWRINRKKDLYNLYYNYLKERPEIQFINTDTSYTCPWFVDIYIDKRDQLQTFLKQFQIGTRAIYPALNTQKINNQQHLNTETELWSERGLWLPSSLDLENNKIIFICSKIKEFYERGFNNV